MELTLKIVTLVLRTATNADAQHVGSLITSFLLPTPNLSLTRAISFNSIELLDSIWDASCTSVEERSPSWTLINYLRSDPCYYRWQFAEAMNAAISCNNLRIVEWLWTHFSWCVVPARAIKLAASQGCLDILKFLQAHDAGYLETVDKMDQNKTSVPAHGREGNVVEWSSYAIQCSFRHLDIALWLYEHVPFYKGSKSLLELIGHILDAGDIERAESLLPAGKNIFTTLDFARDRRWWNACWAVATTRPTSRGLQVYSYLRWPLKAAWISCSGLLTCILHLKRTCTIGENSGGERWKKHVAVVTLLFFGYYLIS